MDPAFRTALAKSLEFALTQALDYDPGSRAALTALAGKTLALEITRPTFSLHVIFSEAGIRVSSYGDQADCTLTGSLPAVFGLLWREHHTLAGSGVTVAGDPGLLQKLQSILGSVELDWEQAITDQLAIIAGSSNASLLIHPLAQLLREGNFWLQRQAHKTPDWLRDYLTEELRLLPSPEELAVFYQDVDEARAQTERLEARVRKLRSSLDQQSHS
jgi:ubiquinone biosynthesis protein UbiJ